MDPFDLINQRFSFDNQPFNSKYRYYSDYAYGYHYVCSSDASISSSLAYYANSSSFPFGLAPESAHYYPHEIGFNVIFTYVPIEIGRPFSCSLLLTVGDYAGGGTQTAEFSWDGLETLQMTLYSYNHTVEDVKSYSLPNGVNTFSGFYLSYRSQLSSFMLSPIFLSNGDLQYVPFQDSENPYNGMGVTFSANDQIDVNLVTLVSQGINFYTLGFGKMLFPKTTSYDYSSSVAFNSSFRLYYLTMLMMSSGTDAFISHLSTFYQTTGQKDVDLSNLSSLLSSISSDTASIKSALDSIYKEINVSGDDVPVPVLPSPDYSAGDALDNTFDSYADYDAIASTLSSWTNQNYLTGLLVFSNVLTNFVDTLDFLKMLFSLVVLFIICGIVRGLSFSRIFSKNEKE